MTFSELGLSDALLHAAESLGFTEPTPIQEQAIPYIIHHSRDVVALAQTGTGKTLAFGFPILQTIDLKKAKTQALILAPTRELCIQISKDLKQYAQYLSDIHIVAVYGGEDIRRQLAQLDRTPHIIVATPGRLQDLLRRGKVDLQEVSFLVLDEADEMLDMGFKDDIETIFSYLPSTRRTMLFSATLPHEVENIVRRYMTDYQTIQIGERNAGTENVDHIYYVCRAENRYLVLKRIVDVNPDIYAIVFCRTKADTQEVAERLIKDGYNADALHGDLTQVARDNVMQRFRLHAVQLLVATDVAARGLDVHNLTHVINYQLPDDPEVYTHRSGRTGRANKRGTSIAILHQRELHRVRLLERMLKREFRRATIPSGLEVCKKQLFWHVARMQNVEIDEEQIAQYMPQVTKMLDYLSKEELIKRFVSLEFNRFLSYYKDAEDLNVEIKQQSSQSKRNDKRKNRDGDDSRKKQEAGRGKGGNTGAKQPSGDNTKVGKGKRMVRLRINVGRSDGMTPKSFLALINQTTHDKSIHIGDIEIQRGITYFSVYPDQVNKLTNAFLQSWDDLTIQEVRQQRR